MISTQTLYILILRLALPSLSFLDTSLVWSCHTFPSRVWRSVLSPNPVLGSHRTKLLPACLPPWLTSCSFIAFPCCDNIPRSWSLLRMKQSNMGPSGGRFQCILQRCLVGFSPCPVLSSTELLASSYLDISQDQLHADTLVPESSPKWALCFPLPSGLLPTPLSDHLHPKPISIHHPVSLYPYNSLWPHVVQFEMCSKCKKHIEYWSLSTNKSMWNTSLIMFVLISHWNIKF